MKLKTKKTIEFEMEDDNYEYYITFKQGEDTSKNTVKIESKSKLVRDSDRSMLPEEEIVLPVSLLVELVNSLSEEGLLKEEVKSNNSSKSATLPSTQIVDLSTLFNSNTPFQPEVEKPSYFGVPTDDSAFSSFSNEYEEKSKSAEEKIKNNNINGEEIDTRPIEGVTSILEVNSEAEEILNSIKNSSDVLSVNDISEEEKNMMLEERAKAVIKNKEKSKKKINRV